MRERYSVGCTVPAVRQEAFIVSWKGRARSTVTGINRISNVGGTRTRGGLIQSTAGGQFVHRLPDLDGTPSQSTVPISGNWTTRAIARILLRLSWFLAYATHITLLVSVLWAERHWVTTFEPLCPFLTSPLSKRFFCAYVFGTIKEGK